MEPFGETLLSKEGNVATKDAAADKKNVMVYFSAHWCPPCRMFTPKLAAMYRQLEQSGQPFEIVFVSGDKDAAAMKDYFASMPWTAVPFDKELVRQQLRQNFEVCMAHQNWRVRAACLRCPAYPNLC